MTSSSEEIKLTALSIIELHLAEEVSWLVSQLVEIQLNRKFLKLHDNLLEGFGVDLKHFLARLYMPNQYCQSVKRKVNFWVIFLG